MLLRPSFAGAGDPASHFYLHADNHQVYRLIFCDDVAREDIVHNSRATVAYRSISGDVMYSCEAPQQQDPARRLLASSTIKTPTKPTFLVYTTTMCGYPAPAVATTQVCGAARPQFRMAAFQWRACMWQTH